MTRWNGSGFSFLIETEQLKETYMSQPGPQTTALLQVCAQGDRAGIVYCAKAPRKANTATILWMSMATGVYDYRCGYQVKQQQARWLEQSWGAIRPLARYQPSEKER